MPGVRHSLVSLSFCFVLHVPYPQPICISSTCYHPLLPSVFSRPPYPRHVPSLSSHPILASQHPEVCPFFLPPFLPPLSCMHYRCLSFLSVCLALALCRISSTFYHPLVQSFSQNLLCPPQFPSLRLTPSQLASKGPNPHANDFYYIA